MPQNFRGDFLTHTMYILRCIDYSSCLLTDRDTGVVDRSTSSSWSSEAGVVTYRSAIFFSSSGQRRDVTVTSLCLALATTSLLTGDVTAVTRLYGVVILLCRWSLELLLRTYTFTGVILWWPYTDCRYKVVLAEVLWCRVVNWRYPLSVWDIRSAQSIGYTI